MAFIIDEEKPRRILAHEVGQDLSALSIEELQERIEILQAEIARLDAARTRKEAQRAAADTVFGRR